MQVQPYETSAAI